MQKPLRSLVVAGIMLLSLVGVAEAWGPHPSITRAALQVIPRLDHWRQVLGPQYDALANYAWMPDQAGQDFPDYYPDDYLLIRAMPHYVNHAMPAVAATWEPYFRRALQALRTETPINACRQMGPLLHFVEDSGAPPHARYISGPLHGPLENWVKPQAIKIPGYHPQLLGANDDAAVAGLKQRMAGLVAFSRLRADRALPLVRQGEVARPQVEPIILESALECSRVTADVLYTVLTLSEAPQPPGAALAGTITTAEYFPGAPGRNVKGARVVLLDNARYVALGDHSTSLVSALSDYSTVAYSSASQPGGVGWQGTYEFRHLKPGVYRVLAYRPGSDWKVSPAVTLEAGRTTRLDVSLTATKPSGNILQNPDATLSYLTDSPDRWQHSRDGRWTSRASALAPGMTYRCGAVLRDRRAQVTFNFVVGLQKPVNITAAVAADGAVTPVSYRCLDKRVTVSVSIQTARPLPQAIERVWVAPEPGKTD